MNMEGRSTMKHNKLKLLPYREFAFWYRTIITRAYNSQKRACYYLGISSGNLNKYCNGCTLPSLRFFMLSIRECCDILELDIKSTISDGLLLIPDEKKMDMNDG